MSTTVVNLKRGEAYDVYIGRAGHGLDGTFGNPFPLGAGRDEALRLFVPWFHRRLETDPVYLERVLGLRGLRLGCFCSPMTCHGHVIAGWIDNFPPEWATAFLEHVRRRLLGRGDVRPAT